MELVSNIGRKLSDALKYQCNKYFVADKTDIEKLADFLYRGTEMNIAAGIFDLKTTTSKQRSETFKKRVELPRSAATFTLVQDNYAEIRRGSNQTANEVCEFCHKSNHNLEHCSGFAQENLDRRWIFVRKSKLCYNCLKKRHGRGNFKQPKSLECKSRNHKLLHK